MRRISPTEMRRDVVKTVCLTAGLAVGLLLVAKIYFEQTYDTCYPEYERLFMMTESMEQEGEYKEYPRVPGGVGTALQRYVPQVERIARIVQLSDDIKLTTEDGRTLQAEGLALADSSMFSVTMTKVLEGNPHEALQVEDMAMIPRSLAEKIGTDAVGSRLSNEDMAGYHLTVGGVYEDFPANSCMPNAVYVSMPSIGKFTYDGRENMMGNDLYNTLVRLAPGTSADDTRQAIEKMLADNYDREALEALHFDIHLRQLSAFHMQQPGVRSMMWMLGLLAVVMVMCAALNYLLLTIGQMGARSREMAVRKCYGTGNLRIFGMVMGESVLFIAVAAALALLLLFCFPSLIERLLGYGPAVLLADQRVWAVEGAVCLALLLVTGAIPAWMYCRTPVASAFRGDVRSRRLWKKALLVVQFAASGMLVCLLALVARQYRLVAGYHLGYDYDNIGIVELYGVDVTRRATLVEELRRLGSVEGVASAYQDFTLPCSGNNVWLDDPYTQINVADYYSVNPEILDVLGMKLESGRNFDMESDSISREVLVDSRFAGVLSRLSGKDVTDAAGERFNISEHGFDGSSEFTVAGVVGEMRRGGFEAQNADMRAAVLFPTNEIMGTLYIRFGRLTPEALREAQQTLERVVTDRELYITPFKGRVESMTATVRNFGTAVGIIGIAILVIALTGLVGYTADEVQRRAKEIAVRKVTGTGAGAIVRLFCRDVIVIALPSLIAGGAGAWLVGRRWLSQFTDQVTLSPAVMALCLVALLALIAGVVALNSYSVASSDPVDHLRDE